MAHIEGLPEAQQHALLTFPRDGSARHPKDTGNRPRVDVLRRLEAAGLMECADTRAGTWRLTARGQDLVAKARDEMRGTLVPPQVGTPDPLVVHPARVVAVRHG